MPARAPPRWFGLKIQILELLRYGNVLAGTADELYVLALAAVFLAAVAIRGRPTLERSWRIPLLAALALVAYLIAPFEMGYMGYIHTRAIPFFVLLTIAAPAIAPGRKTGVALAAVVAPDPLLGSSSARTATSIARRR